VKGKIGLILVLAIFCAALPGSLAEAPLTYAGKGFEYILQEDGAACLTRYTGADRALLIPSDIDGHTVKALGKDVFPKGLGVTSILIPASVKEIGAGAFRFLDKLVTIGVINVNSVYASAQGVLFDKSKKMLHTYPRGRGGMQYGIPRGIETIADNAFYRCQYLESVFIPSSVFAIGSEAFYGSKKLTNLRLPDSIKTIGGKAFAGCTGLVYMEIQENVTSIGPGAFMRCENLEDIGVDERNLTYASINGTLVEKETKLLHTFLIKKASSVIRIPGGVKAIGAFAFSDCFTIKEITVPASVTSIGEEAFARCYNLASIVMPDSDLSIEPGAFLDCLRLSMTIREGSDAHKYAVENKIPFALDIQ
jgi:hypothetical protein